MSNVKVVDVIIRKTAEKKKLTGDGNLSVLISSPSVIEIQGSAQDVVRYVRQGKDLLIYMKDGSIIRCNNYFVEDPETHHHSELVFNDQQELTHISFADTGEASGTAFTELIAQATPINSIEPFLEQESVLSDTAWGWIAGAALGGGVIGALLANGGDGETKVIDNTKEVESARPTFLLLDKVGDKQGVLSANAITDDNTPTFSGGGQPGATIQIKDGSGSTIASAMVGKDGTWTVKLPPQSDGEHTWSVVQIDGSKTTSAGSITVTVSTAEASITLATTAGDNVINTSEQSAGFTLSGSSQHLAKGTDVSVTLNGKTYTVKVGADGAWSVNVPAADAQALGDGTWTVNVSGKDAAGNTVSGSQTISVDTTAPTLSVDTLAQDNIINASEHNQPLTLTGKTNAEAGQIVTVTLNDKNYNATVGSDGSWSVTIAANEVQALNEGNHTLTVNVSDKAGNGTSVTADFQVHTVAPVITINAVAGDDILNTSEQSQAQIISGQANGAAAGDVVTVTVGDKAFTGVVLADGSWSVGVPASAVGTLGEGHHTLSVSVTDATGNTSSATHDITLSGTPPEFTIDAISQDNVLNAQEVMQPLHLSGTSNLPDGSDITVMLNNVSYLATVENGIWSVQVPVSDVLNLANTLYTVTVSGTDSVGNSGSAGATLLVDTVLPQVIINTFAGDNLVNNAEAGVDQTLSGYVTGAAAGDAVSVTVGGNSYSATVGSDLTWHVTIPSADLQAFGDGDLTFAASVTNGHGNTSSSSLDVTINAQLPGLRIDTIAGDDVINIIEHSQNLIVSGSSTDLVTGSTVTVTINGNIYSATVSADGTWKAAIPAEDVSQWADGALEIKASAQDTFGNPVKIGTVVEVDLAPVAISINSVTADNVLNATEKGQDLVLSGTSSNVEAGQTVTITFAGKTWTTTVDDNGDWTYTVPAADLSNLKDGNTSVNVNVTNVSGNTASSAQEFRIDTTAPTISINTISNDNMLNAAEAVKDLTLSGSTTAEAGQTVTVSFNGKYYTAQVQADGRWTLDVPAADLVGITDGHTTVTASVSDKAGNPASADTAILVDTTVPQISFNIVAGDDIVNIAEHDQALIISGKVTGAQTGDVITVTLNDKDYSAILDVSGSWSVNVPAADVAALTAGDYTITAALSDKAGNSNSAAHSVEVNLSVPTLTIDTVSGDDVINSSEKTQDLTISGTASGLATGAVVTVMLNGKVYDATVDANGKWTTTVPAAQVGQLGEALYTVIASATNGVGNSTSTSHAVNVESVLPGIIINTVAGDNVINAAELAAGQIISGSVVNAEAGNTVIVTLGGKTYTATVQNDLTWSVNVTQAELTALGNGELTVSASVTNGVGNRGSAEHDITIDANLPGLRIDTVAGDDVINSIEHTQNLIITGTSDGLTAGTALTVTVNNKTYPATVLADGTWSAAIPAADVGALAAGTVTVSVAGQNSSGNPVAITHDVTVDLAAVAVSIDAITSDDVINAAEKGTNLVLSGTSVNVEENQIVSIIFAGKGYTASIGADGKWSVVVPSADLSTLREGAASVQVSVTNVNGNSASAGREYSVDTIAPSVTINTIAGDDILNVAEAKHDLIVSGTSTAGAGQTVTVSLNGKKYTTIVSADGSWTLNVPAVDVAMLGDGSVTVTALVHDKAGNPASVDHKLMVDITAPAVTINTVAGDDVINIVEHAQAQIISGSATGAAVGDKVIVTLGGKTYTTVLDAEGNWSVGVPASVISSLQDGTVTVSATITDSAGNRSTQTHDVVVNTASVALTVNTLSGDDVINAAEAGNSLVIDGSSTLFASGTQVTVALNGKTYTATIQRDGSWATTIPAADVGALIDGVRYQVSVFAQDSAGNSALATHDISVDTTAPMISIATLSGDDVLNAAEMQQPLTVHGVSSAEAGQIVTVTLGGKAYISTVANDGSWTLDVPAADLAALSQGALTVTALVNDKAGNPGSTTHDITLNGDVPTITINTFAEDDIVSAAEHGSSLVISGTTDAPAGQVVTLTLNGKTYTATVQRDGTWSYTLGSTDVNALADGGSYVIHAQVSNAIGNSASDTHTVTVDITAPSMGISIDSLQNDTGLSTSDFITNDRQVVINGSLTAQPGNNEKAQISLDGGETWINLIVTGTTWRYTDGRTLTDGSYQYLVRVIDNAGNVGATDSQDVVIDLTKPAATTITVDSVSQDTGLSDSDFITSDNQISLKGTLSAALGRGDHAQISVDGGVTWIDVSVSGLNWTYVDGRTLADGDYNYQLRVIDDAGNISATTSQVVTIDTVAPDASKTISIDRISDDTGLSSSDFITNDTSLTLHGSLGATLADGEYAQISIDGGVTWQNVIVTGNNWYYVDNRTLGSQNYDYYVRVVDAAGNVGASAHQQVTVDTQAPQHGITIDSISEDTGQSGSDFITMDTTLTINGSLGNTLANDERVQISLDGGHTWSDVTVTNQRWSYTDTRDLADGDYTYQVRIIDLAGNVGSTASQVVTVDTTPPATVGTVVSYTDVEGERTGTFGSLFATDDSSPVLNGTLNRAPDDGEIVQLYRDGILLGQVTMNGSTGWFFQDNGLNDGKHTYIVRVTDKAGNYTESDGFVLNVDTSIPTTTATITAQTTSDTTPIVSGTVSADLVNGEYLEVMVNGKAYTSQTGGAVVIDPAHNTWYLQIPASDALNVMSYSPTVQVKSSAGNGNTTGTTTGSLVIDTTSVNTDWATVAGSSTNATMTPGMNSSGLWNIIANSQSYSSSDILTYTGNTLTNTRRSFVVSQTAADFDRNGTQDIFATENIYAGATQVMWTYDGSAYHASQLNMGTTILNGGVIAYDKTGDGYLDLAYGDSGANSITYLSNNKGVLSPDGLNGGAGLWGQFATMREISSVDINNDGTVDVVQHTNRGGLYSLTVINNNGNGTLSVGQDLTNVFVPNFGYSTITAASMTWADFNGDGYMDLYLGSSYNNNGGVIYYNDGTGKLSDTKSAVEASNAAAGYLSVAVDWNGDGQMDIIKLSTYSGSQTATLFTNNDYGSTWTSSQLASGIAYATGAAAVDYNWDGAKDLLVSQQNGKIVLIQNSKTIADGTAMHLHIVDSEGINVYYGNTVNLYNAAGVLVASQIINAQSGIGSNDASALVSFYGLDPNETYSAEIVKITNGVSDNVTWSGLEAGNGKEGYVLTADAVTGGHSGTLTGTGYNDTFIAEKGTYTYNGSGGWNTHSDYDTWSNTGGMDVVDYRNAASGVTVDLRLSTAQDTGFGITRLLNIEGINGSDFDDVITGNSADNRFEGRGGNDTFNIGSGGHDTLLYKLLNASDATGGNGHDVVNGFTVGTWEGTADTDRIDLRDLLSGSGYTGTGSASYVNGVATLDSNAGNITDYIRVQHNGSNTEIQVDLDGTGGQFSPTTLVTLNGVQTDLATLLANHQLLIA